MSSLGSPGQPAQGLQHVEETAGGDTDHVETEGEYEDIQGQRLGLVLFLRGQEHLQETLETNKVVFLIPYTYF